MAKLLIVVAAALIDGDGRVLLAQRPVGKADAGLWEFPGGKLDHGETPEGALVRELKEELGIDVEASCLSPVSFASCRLAGAENVANSAQDPAQDVDLAGVHLLMPLFACRKWDGVAQPMEAQALSWVRPQRFRDYNLAPADKPLAAVLRDIL